MSGQFESASVTKRHYPLLAVFETRIGDSGRTVALPSSKRKLSFQEITSYFEKRSMRLFAFVFERDYACTYWRLKRFVWAIFAYDANRVASIAPGVEL